MHRLHDRKLSVLGLCSLLSMTNTRPQEVTAAAAEVLPSMLILFQGLKRAYASMWCRASSRGYSTYNTLNFDWHTVTVFWTHVDPSEKKIVFLISISRANNSSHDHGRRIWNNPLSYCHHIAVNSFTNVDYKIEMHDDTKHRSPLHFQFLISHRFAFVSCIKFFFWLPCWHLLC